MRCMIVCIYYSYTEWSIRKSLVKEEEEQQQEEVFLNRILMNSITLPILLIIIINIINIRVPKI